jgi:F-type H+-transporting ATPase subunit b
MPAIRKIVMKNAIAKRTVARIALMTTGLLMLLAVSAVGLASLIAQDRPASRQEPQVKKETQSEGPGRQLARMSNEGAGIEKDEMQEFKQSSSVLLISRLTGLNPQRSYWLSLISNFIIIACLIFWACRKYLPGIFRDRTAAIQKAMREAQAASEEARRKLAEIESRLSKLDVEINHMREAAEKEGLAEQARIQAAAKEDARKIVAAAEQEIAAAIKAARRQLTAHAAELAVGLAQRQIRVDLPTDQALIRNFAGQLGAVPDHPGKDGN